MQWNFYSFLICKTDQVQLDRILSVIKDQFLNLETDSQLDLFLSDSNQSISFKPAL